MLHTIMTSISIPFPRWGTRVPCPPLPSLLALPLVGLGLDKLDPCHSPVIAPNILKFIVNLVRCGILSNIMNTCIANQSN